MPEPVERRLRSIRRRNPGMTYAKAIQILKGRGILRQKGRHLALGPRAKENQK